MADILRTIERYRALGIDQQIDYKKFYLYSIITHSTALSLDDKGKQYENYLVGPYEEVPNQRFEAFVASQETDVPQGVPQDITALIKQNPKITREELAALLHVSVKTIGRRLAKLPHIKYVGSGYSGHWEIIE